MVDNAIHKRTHPLVDLPFVPGNASRAAADTQRLELCAGWKDGVCDGPAIPPSRHAELDLETVVAVRIAVLHPRVRLVVGPIGHLEFMKPLEQGRTGRNHLFPSPYFVRSPHKILDCSQVEASQIGQIFFYPLEIGDTAPMRQGYFLDQKSVGARDGTLKVVPTLLTTGPIVPLLSPSVSPSAFFAYDLTKKDTYVDAANIAHIVKMKGLPVDEVVDDF